MAAGPTPQVAQALKSVSEQYRIPLWHLYAVAARESGFDTTPSSINDWDWASKSPYPGSGLFQLTGEGWHQRKPDLKALGEWHPVIDIYGPNSFSEMTDIFDPYQNARRYAEYAGPWYNYMKGRHPDWSEDDLWDSVAYNWTHGMYEEWRPGMQHPYMPQYKAYAQAYKQQLPYQGMGDPYAGTGPGGVAGPQLSPQQMRENQRQQAMQQLGLAPSASLGGIQGQAPGQPKLSPEEQRQQAISQSQQALRIGSGAMPPAYRTGSAALGLSPASAPSPYQTGSAALGMRPGVQQGLRTGMDVLGGFAPPGMQQGLRLGANVLGGGPSLDLPSWIMQAFRTGPSALGGGFGAGAGFLGNVGQAALQRIMPITSIAAAPWESYYNKIKGGLGKLF